MVVVVVATPTLDRGVHHVAVVLPLGGRRDVGVDGGCVGAGVEWGWIWFRFRIGRRGGCSVVYGLVFV